MSILCICAGQHFPILLFYSVLSWDNISQDMHFSVCVVFKVQADTELFVYDILLFLCFWND